MALKMADSFAKERYVKDVVWFFWQPFSNETTLEYVAF